MSTETIFTIASLTIGILGFLFGIYTHFATRRFANVSYELTQLTDFGLPDSFLAPLSVIPFAVVIKSVGNKKAESVNIRIVTATDITNLTVESGEPFEKAQDTRQVQIRIPSLNPEETVKISAQCAKAQSVTNYISEMSVTHSEGAGIDKKALRVSEIELDVPFPFWRPRIVYNFEKRRFQIR